MPPCACTACCSSAEGGRFPLVQAVFRTSGRVLSAHLGGALGAILFRDGVATRLSPAPESWIPPLTKRVHLHLGATGVHSRASPGMRRWRRPAPLDPRVPRVAAPSLHPRDAAELPPPPGWAATHNALGAAGGQAPVGSGRPPDGRNPTGRRSACALPEQGARDPRRDPPAPVRPHRPRPLLCASLNLRTRSAPLGPSLCDARRLAEQQRNVAAGAHAHRLGAAADLLVDSEVHPTAQ